MRPDLSEDEHRRPRGRLEQLMMEPRLLDVMQKYAKEHLARHTRTGRCCQVSQLHERLLSELSLR